MRQYLSLFVILIPFLALAQEELQGVYFNDGPLKTDSVPDSLKSTVPKLINWRLNGDLLTRYKVVPDTLMSEFYRYNPIYKKSILNNFTGNYGSPYQSMIYFDRERDLDFIFEDRYVAYMDVADKVSYFNTRFPYTKLIWTNGGPSSQEEESIHVLHSRNVNEKLNFTGSGYMIYGRGLYRYNATKHINFNLHSNYIGERYQLHAGLATNTMNNFESGGIVDPDNIENPDPNSQQIRFPEDIPTHFNIDAISKLYSFGSNIQQRYLLGFNKDVALEDTVVREFVPVSSITHEMNYKNNIKYYSESANPDYEMHPDTNYFYSSGAMDRYRMQLVSNKLGLFYNEGVSKFTPFGIGGFIRHEYVHIENNPWYYWQSTINNNSYSEALEEDDDLAMDSASFHGARNYTGSSYTNLSVGGTLFKKQGKNFFFDTRGEFFFSGYRVGDYSLKGEAQLRFFILDSALIAGSVELNGERPDYFYNNYSSNYFKWSHNFDRVNTQRTQAQVKWDKFDVELKLSLENIFNYVYFDKDALPTQHNGTVQVMALNLDKDFTFWKFHWNNKFVYQTTSHQNVIPLPTFSAYTDFFYLNKFFGVLNTQVGFDLRYHTAYNALRYMPATGRFYVQDEFEVGNYPLVNAYVNLQLKRMRIFVMYQHVNEGLAIRNYWASPYYAYNPRMLKLGISWNFYD